VGAGHAAIGAGVLSGRPSRWKQAELLTVTLGHRDDLLIDRDELSVGLLRTSAALRTNRKRLDEPIG
jgi:hypothetical protein